MMSVLASLSEKIVGDENEAAFLKMLTILLEAFNRAVEQEVALKMSRFEVSFLSKMSHELRTPLNAIIGFSGLLEQETVGPLLPRQKEYVNNILSGGEHLLHLLKEAMDTSKDSSGE